MENAKKFISIAILVLALVSLAVLALGFFTGAFGLIMASNLAFFFLSLACFLFSIIAWLSGWCLLVMKRGRRQFGKVFGAGFASVFGALTPIQLGSDVLRGLFLKEEFNANFSEGFSASMIVKGLKFSILSFVSVLLLSFALFSAAIDASLALPLFSGLFVVLLASLLFLLPLDKKTGHRISRLFGSLSKTIHFLKPLEKYFLDYSEFLGEFSGRALLATMLFAAVSWAFEFASLFFAFAALSIGVSPLPLAVLFVLLALLERAPFLPRGILLVESAGFAFLSFPIISASRLSVAEISSVLIIYDASRLIFPTVASLLFYFLWKKSRKSTARAKI
ncbi:MAG: flippase-like domain-containing protein [Candidatus Diapherotrites archaeon]|nr:flippase-like domain-containing protein [Candidatus Diapherotrites archaeon]